jgi:hypothetical protein
VLYAQKRLEEQVDQDPLIRRDLVHVRQAIATRKTA